jgi:hypothetical protein
MRQQREFQGRIERVSDAGAKHGAPILITTRLPGIDFKFFKHSRNTTFSKKLDLALQIRTLSLTIKPRRAGL